MSDDTHDHTIDLAEPHDYEHPVSQRAMAFCHATKLADNLPRHREIVCVAARATTIK